MLNPAARSVLESSPLFRGVGLEAVGHLLEACALRKVAKGEALIDPAAPNDSLYVILAGQLRIYLSGRDLPAQAVLEVGDCAGELSLIDGKPPSALVIAANDTEVLAIPRAVLWSLVDSSHAVARNLLGILAGRIRHDNLAQVTTAADSLEFEQAVSVDALTGLHNRRWAETAFPRALDRCERDGHPVCLVMADIDHFREFNADHGHLVGDALLRRIAAQLAAGLRTQDLIARHGGEEFAILLPRTTTLEGLEIAQRLRAGIEQIRFSRHGQSLAKNVTISCGVAPLRLGDTLDTLTAAADQALARAKAGGRNRVEVSADD